MMARHTLLALAAALLVGAGLAERGGRAVDGVATDITEAPWLVQFMYFDGDSFEFSTSCTGTIVSDTQVLTAAHCLPADVVADPQDKLKVRVGATKKQEGGVVHAVESIVTHPNFEDIRTDQPWDLAIINLAAPVEFGDSTKAIEVAEERIAANATAVSGGWGTTRKDASYTSDSFAPGLQTVEMTLKDDEACRSLITRTVGGSEAAGNLLCFKPRAGTICLGDSGTGLWAAAEDGEAPRLYGVMHGANSCDPASGTPIFVDVSAAPLRDFLDENLKRD